MNIWMNQLSWAPECQGNGVIVRAGEGKPLFEDTDNSGWPDILDADNDNDGIGDGDDPEPDSKANNGKPDWWCDKNPGKC